MNTTISIENNTSSPEERFFNDILEGNGDTEVLIFTNLGNVYKVKSQMDDREYIYTKVQFDEGEKPIYSTRTKNYSGYLIVSFENGKTGKIFLDSYKTELNRKKLKNAFNDESKILFIKHIDNDIDLVLLSSINKVVLFNTSKINPVGSRTTKGVQVMKSKHGSLTTKVKELQSTKLSDPEYYRKDLNIVGYYLKQGDEI